MFSAMAPIVMDSKAMAQPLHRHLHFLQLTTRICRVQSVCQLAQTLPVLWMERVVRGVGVKVRKGDWVMV